MIVGGGLAGCFMAAESLRRGHRVVMWDAAEKWSPSRVAAGLYNIITGRVASKTWMAETFLASLADFFSQPPFDQLADLLHPRPIYRPYKTIAERNEWFFKTAHSEFKTVARHRPAPWFPEQVHNPWGGLEILPCGWLEAGTFIERVKALMQEHFEFEWVAEQMDYRVIDAASGRVDVGGKEMAFDEIIFAEGPAVRKNPWFGDVDIRPLKGQVLEISLPGLPPDFVLLRKAYLVPRGIDRYVVGSTYEKDFSDLNPTSEGISTLTEYVRTATPLPFEIVAARAGARPTTPNRRPICGQHSDYPSLFIFNGLGTKGVLQAPWTAGHFRDWLDHRIPALLPDVALERLGK